MRVRQSVRAAMAGATIAGTRAGPVLAATGDYYRFFVNPHTWGIQTSSQMATLGLAHAEPLQDRYKFAAPTLRRRRSIGTCNASANRWTESGNEGRQRCSRWPWTSLFHRRFDVSSKQAGSWLLAGVFNAVEVAFMVCAGCPVSRATRDKAVVPCGLCDGRTTHGFYVNNAFLPYRFPLRKS